MGPVVRYDYIVLEVSRAGWKGVWKRHIEAFTIFWFLIAFLFILWVYVWECHGTWTLPSVGGVHYQPQVVSLGGKCLNQLSHEPLFFWLLPALHVLIRASCFLTIIGRGNWILPWYFGEQRCLSHHLSTVAVGSPLWLYACLSPTFGWE